MNPDEDLPLGGATNAFDATIDDSMLETHYVASDNVTCSWTQDGSDRLLAFSDIKESISLTHIPIGTILKAKDSGNANDKYFICRGYRIETNNVSSWTFVGTQNETIRARIESNGYSIRFVNGAGYFNPLTESHGGFRGIKLPETVPFTVRHFIANILMGLRETWYILHGQIVTINNTLASHSARISTLESS